MHTAVHWTPRRRLLALLLCMTVACLASAASLLAAAAPSPADPASASPLPSPAHAPAAALPATLALTPAAPVTDAPAPSSGVVPHRRPSRFAYVMMHYEGTPKDDEYLLGLRVLIRSIRDTNTPYDIVVILSENVRESTKQTLLDDGAMVNQVPNLKNPFETKVQGRNSYKSRFIYSLNKLYLWNMTSYERVAFLDSDNIFLQNMDDVFLCGHFCIVYMNPLIFHTGLIVAKPSTDMFHKLIQALYSDESFSHDGADQGFLVSQFDVEHAPLFLPSEHVPRGVPSEEPAMRLNIGWNLNHFWYYIAFDWHWFFHAGAGAEREYPWVREYRDREGSSDVVAGSSLAYCSGMMLKPWYWFPTMYFDHHYTWHEYRARLGINYWPIFLSRIAAFAPVFLLFHYLSDRARIDRVPALEPARNLLRQFFLLAPVQLGYALGVLCFFLNGYVSFQLIPYVTPPPMAWTIWSVWMVGLAYAELKLFVNFAMRPTLGTQKRSLLLQASKGAAAEREEADHAAASVTGRNAFLLLVGAQLLFFANWLHIYPHFIVKIAVFEYLLLMWIGLTAHAFRRAAERMAQLSRIGLQA